METKVCSRLTMLCLLAFFFAGCFEPVLQPDGCSTGSAALEAGCSTGSFSFFGKPIASDFNEKILAENVFLQSKGIPNETCSRLTLHSEHTSQTRTLQTLEGDGRCLRAQPPLGKRGETIVRFLVRKVLDSFRDPVWPWCAPKRTSCLSTPPLSLAVI